MVGAREDSLTVVAAPAEVYPILAVLFLLAAFIVVVVSCTSRSDKHQLQEGAESSPGTGSRSHVVRDLTASCVQCCREIWQKPPEEDEDENNFRSVTIVITPPSPKVTKRTPSDSDADCDATKEVTVFVNNNNNNSSSSSNSSIVHDEGGPVTSKSADELDSSGKSDFLHTR